MNSRKLLEIFHQQARKTGLFKAFIADAPHSTVLHGLQGSAAAVYAASLMQDDFPLQVFILRDTEEAAYLRTDLENLIEREILHLEPSSRKPFQPHNIDSLAVLRRTDVLNQLSHKPDRKIVVTCVEAFAERVIGRANLEKNTYSIAVGEPFDLEFLMELLAENHFERVDTVLEAGQFAIRGGIIDVFSFAHEMPYRIELDGEKVESIRVFDTEDQLSVKKVREIQIVPNPAEREISGDKVSIFQYLPENTVIWLHNGADCTEYLNSGLERLMTADGEEAKNAYLDCARLKTGLESLNVIQWGTRHILKGHEIEFHTRPQDLFHKNFDHIARHFENNTAGNYQNLVFSEGARQIERLISIFNDMGRGVHFEPIYKGLSQGFTDDTLKIACLTEHQLFDRFYKSRQKKGYSASQALSLKELRELKPGDYVVHIDHGIGRFGGLEKMEMNGTMAEAVRLVYKNEDLLYVHINSLHKISKYVGKDGIEPKMNRLGSDTWQKLKQSTKKKVKDIARDLIKLYAKRKAQPGFAYSPDSYLQTELEASFIYEDTPDQLKATEDFKKDMESPHPMDRLVCGDVGFGKTEVAVRAAFKAVCDSKQVAVLVPTTLLAFQHFKTFKGRLEGFPAEVEYLSRFKSAKQQKEILQKLEEGKIDIIIGTHKLLSSGIKFKNLGLLIIDEEQKFGVAAKEKLKQFRVNIDTLTLTATPIPRTLHFSLMGARDLSIINTPPPNRRPVRTELHTFNQEVLREAINFELSREGQVFFIHHRVKDIYDIAEMIERLVPGARVGVGHGQMGGEELEDIMIRFVQGELDVLVATTIIESGLDIPNANTIIINNAHMFGLSDLHQMRGRVGRSNRKAFCYLFSPPLSTLTQEARKRLQAIEQFSELGRGFNVAMRDLDIRGAGNLLGAEQSGFIAEIGYDMYHKILDEAVRELKEEEFKDLFQDEIPAIESYDCAVDSDETALLPDGYVRSIAERLSLYNELANIKDDAGLLAFREAIADRFGTPPDAVERLIISVQIKWMGMKLGLERIVLRNQNLTLYFPANQASSYYQSETFGRFIAYISQYPSRCKMKQTPKALTLSVEKIGTLENALDWLQQFSAIEAKEEATA